MKEKLAKVLIANRGEIAIRIMRTLQRLGIESVAVYHAVDEAASFVALADERVEIFGDTPTAAYLDVDQLIDVARRHEVAAVHPGYGFLAENAAFAAAVAAAGIKFIGPEPDVIRLLGDKITARTFVDEHGFPLAPSIGVDGDDWRAQIEAIGYPILIKAAAGGGGKGMHIVHAADELDAALASARSEGQRYFSDARVYCEKYLPRPRHIEVQILADEHGHCVHLGERDCSVQRRFQKVIEETPAPGLDPALRDEICNTAVAIATAARYTNAGTVEFILGDDGEYYFLEMNTRLQVEHPVTEMVTGIDLVEAQLRIAAGEPLPFAQHDIHHEGHAIEMRICAEDCEAGFVPATGTVALLRDATGEGVRIDSGLSAGMRVTSAFDPMLAKLIVHAANRDAAIESAARAAAEQVILGVTTNLGFLQRVVRHTAFAAGEVHTHFIEQHAAALQRAAPGQTRTDAILALAALNDPGFRRLVYDSPPLHAAIGAWRNA
jgi:propionyl-CoA carboxylase alpha chain/3-methylcrotonyl-CoA carboxylase alpha subunit/acetyl-CoA/propionyl-CoA carboxylase biotin carboxyl carrier protein